MKMVCLLEADARFANISRARGPGGARGGTARARARARALHLIGPRPRLPPASRYRGRCGPDLARIPPRSYSRYFPVLSMNLPLETRN